MYDLFDREQIMKAHDKTVFNEGFKEGFNIGRGIVSIVNVCKSSGLTCSDAVQQVMENYGLDKETTEKYVEEIWQKLPK